MAAIPQLPPQALHGIRVLDFSHVIAGPFATFKIFGRTVKIGWQQETLGKVPVLSLS